MELSQNKWETIKGLAERRGVSSGAFRKWMERGYVPGKWHLELLAEAEVSGANLSQSDFRQNTA